MDSIHDRIKVVNVRGLDPRGDGAGIVYVGRRCRGWHGSVLGNPFRIGVHGSREEVIRKYREWLYKRLETDPQVQSAIMDLVWMLHGGERVRLGCWCTPLPCHAEVIKEVVVEHYQALFN
jgi:hypothetical protein